MQTFKNCFVKWRILMADQNKLAALAKESLDKFEEISSAAQKKLMSYTSDFSQGVFASPGDRAYGYRALTSVSETVKAEYKHLEREPAVARVAIENIDDGKTEIFYICRNTPPSNVKNVLSYRAPMGRLGALEVGGEYNLGEETQMSKYDDIDIKKIENTTFEPILKDKQWDSAKTIYKSIKDLLCIDSLRALLSKKKNNKDILAEILEADEQEENINNKIRKDIVETFSLRDQPILDYWQDEIFRLPLQRSLLLIGPAGSGKTTTLIQRLGQKLDREQGLSEEERNLVERYENDIPYEDSWLMFTPTNLLKSYLQEAFNRQHIAAPDANISTWEDYSLYLGREVFKILYTQQYKSGFIHDTDACTLKYKNKHLIDIYKDFYDWTLEDYAKEIINGLGKRSMTEELKNNKILDAVFTLSKKHLEKNKDIISFFKEIKKYKDEIESYYKQIKDKTDNIINQELNKQLNINREFLKELSIFLKSITQDGDEDTDGDIFNDEEVASKTDVKKAILNYRQAILYLSQNKNTSSKKSAFNKNTTILKWLETRIPDEATLVKLCTLVEDAKIISTVYKPINKFFRSINKRYKNFRMQRQQDDKWYNKDSTLRKKINTTEFDILILINLKISHELLISRDIYDNTEDSWFSILKTIKGKYVDQVLVDEAPDFSPLQLASMKLLAHPQINSFFACGDFNQRLTSIGANNVDELKEFLPKPSIELREITVPYRQSENLYNFSSSILKMMNYETASGIPNKPITMMEGVSPVLGKHLAGKDLTQWVAERITEIENLLKTIPSIAILVPEEEYVKPVAENLQKMLNLKTTIKVQACLEGQTKGNEKAVRVFDIKHIKGLEFEAAFFVAVDKLEKIYPDLLWNYLYVGATSATTFLGVSYEEILPKSIEDNLLPYFVDTWSTK